MSNNPYIPESEKKRIRTQISRLKERLAVTSDSQTRQGIENEIEGLEQRLKFGKNPNRDV